MKILLLIALGIGSGIVMAQDQIPLDVIALEDGAYTLWTLKSIKGDVDHPSVRDRIRVYSGEKTTGPVLCEFIADDISFFTGAKLIKLSKYPRPLLATDWIRGVRSPCLRIFDPSLGKTALLKEFCSIDLKYEVMSDHIDVSEFRYKDKDDSSLIEFRTEWSPIGETPAKAAPSDNPAAPQNP